MRAYVIRRVLLLIPTVFLLTILVFLSVRFIPGDAVDLLIFRMTRASGGMGTFDRAELERRLGLDVPVHVQYGRWMGGILLHGNLGTPLLRPEPVGQLIAGRLPTTMELGLVALFVGVLIGVPIGIVGGAVIMEQMFAIPGLGRLMIEALFDRDYPIISGINLVFAVAVMVINLLVDVLYAYLDPRVQYG